MMSTAFPPGSFGSKLEHFETSYLEYLYDARCSIEKCAHACQQWQYPYDGDTPTQTSLFIDVEGNSVDMVTEVAASDISVPDGRTEGSDQDNSNMETNDANVDNRNLNAVESAIIEPDISQDTDISTDQSVSVSKYRTDEEFIQMLEQSGSPLEKSVNVEESVSNLDSVLGSLSVTISCTSTPRKDSSKDQTFGAEEEMSTVYYDCESSQNPDSELFKSINDTSYEIIDGVAKSKTTGDNATAFDIINSEEMDTTNNNNNNREDATKQDNVTSFVEVGADNSTKAEAASSSVGKKLEADGMLISFDHFSAEKKSTSAPKMGILVSKQDAEESQGKGDKSVRFSETTHVKTFSGLSTSKSLPAMGSIGSVKSATQPNIGKSKAVWSSW